MRSDAALSALHDIAHHIELAVGFAAGFDYETFRDDLSHGLCRDSLSRDHLRGLASAA
jgi:hypothetical protein